MLYDRMKEIHIGIEEELQMNKEKTERKIILVVLGLLLILIQLINYCGVSRMRVGLLPDDELLSYPGYITNDGNLNIKMVFFAFEAGFDRFASGFEDLTFPEDEWRVASATQYASAMFRESLGCSDGGSFGLIVYDFFVILSYCLVGIIGMVFLILAAKIDQSSDSEDEETFCLDDDQADYDQQIEQEQASDGTWVCCNCETHNKNEYGQCKKCGQFRTHPFA